MGVHILSGELNGSTTEAACLVDSVTGVAFGPVFDTHDGAQAFLEWLPGDARALSPGDLAQQIAEWAALPTCSDCEDKVSAVSAKRCDRCADNRHRDAEIARSLR